MAQSKSDVDSETLEPLSQAEQGLIDCCNTGQPLVLGMTAPDKATDENSIRGPLIRHLLLGGCDEAPAHAKGVRISGAYITQTLDFEYGQTHQALLLQHCKVAEDLDFDDCRIRSIFLSGSEVAGLRAQRAKVEQSIFMDAKFHAKGPVILRGAKIGGQLACVGGQFDQGLNGNALVVKADVFLRNGFHAKEPVDLRGAEIGGQLDCSGGQFDDVVTFSEMTVGNTFFWRRVKGKFTSVVLDDAHVGTLVDDMASWRDGAALILDGFTYDNLSGRISVADRLDWLARNYLFDVALADQVSGDFKQALGKDFEPQPYTQLAGVLNKMGHSRGAGHILAKRDQLQKRSEWARARLPKSTPAWVDRRALVVDLKRPFDWVFGIVFGYGHLPGRAVLWAFGIIVSAIVFYDWVYSAGQIAPNSDVILTSVDWRLIADVTENQNPAQIWSDSLAGRDYETFDAIGYGIDLFIPLDALGQENAWAPSKDRGMLGKVGFYLRWLIQFSGWVITAVGAATLTGLVGRK